MTNHIQHLNIVLQLLQAHQFFVKESKCNLAAPIVTYLGHIIQQGTVSSDPKKKNQVILQWLEPKSFTTLRAFLGITGFYQKFICGYATLASPLTDLLKLKVFTWNHMANTTFLQFKNILTTPSILHLLDFTIPFIVEMDVSNSAIGMFYLKQGILLPFSLRSNV